MSVRILVVDDEPDVAELLSAAVSSGYPSGRVGCLHYATSGAEALDRLAGEIEPTRVAVLSDINMPGMDGAAIARRDQAAAARAASNDGTAYGDDEERRLQAAVYGAV